MESPILRSTAPDKGGPRPELRAIPRRLFIHVGPPKTGTSAIQSLFKDIDDPQLTYPRAGQWPDGSHNLLGFALQGARQWGNVTVPPIETLAGDIAAELDAAPKDALISSEGLANPATYTKLRARLADSIARFDTVRPILTLRHPIERAASDYNQRVKDAQHGAREFPDAALASRIASLRVTPTIEAWRQAAPDTMLLPYHPAQSLVARFCDLIERPDLAPAEAPWHNRSLGGVGLALLLLGNRLLPDAAARHRFLAEDLKGHPQVKLWQGHSFPFSPEAVARAMEDVVNADLANAREAYGLDLGDWHPPGAAVLSDDDREMVRSVATALLPDTSDRAAEIERVLSAFPPF